MRILAVAIDDPIAQTVFAIYAIIALDTTHYNKFHTTYYACSGISHTLVCRRLIFSLDNVFCTDTSGEMWGNSNGMVDDSIQPDRICGYG